jgi:hypothetical protein
MYSDWFSCCNFIVFFVVQGDYSYQHARLLPLATLKFQVAGLRVHVFGMGPREMGVQCGVSHRLVTHILEAWVSQQVLTKPHRY